MCVYDSRIMLFAIIMLFMNRKKLVTAGDPGGCNEQLAHSHFLKNNPIVLQINVAHNCTAKYLVEGIPLLKKSPFLMALDFPSHPRSLYSTWERPDRYPSQT